MLTKLNRRLKFQIEKIRIGFETFEMCLKRVSKIINTFNYGKKICVTKQYYTFYMKRMFISTLRSGYKKIRKSFRNKCDLAV